MYRITIATAAPILTMAAFLVASPHAYGDGMPQIAQQTQQQTPQASFSDEQLESFAAAVVEVRNVNQEWQQRIQQTQDPQQERQLREEATQKMAEAIEDEGLTVQEYNQITQAARQNPEVYDKVTEYIQQAE